MSRSASERIWDARRKGLGRRSYANYWSLATKIPDASDSPRELGWSRVKEDVSICALRRPTSLAEHRSCSPLHSANSVQEVALLSFTLDSQLRHDNTSSRS